MDKVQTMEIVSVNFSHALFSLLSAHNIWWCRPLFGSAWFGSERSGLAWLAFVCHADL